ncbi:MAG: methyltransferase domain-containing protein [Candidatus Kryptonium sp.]
MKYEKIKSKIDEIISEQSFLRKILYAGLNILLLRAWYVKSEVQKFFVSKNEKCNVLDAGCGFGQYSYFIAKKFKNSEVLGVDINERRIKDCEKFARTEKIENLKFEIADLTKLNFAEKFDLILAIDVMEHIEDDEEVFKNFYKAMKKNGLLIISTPSNLGGSEVHSDEDESFIEEHVRSGYGADEIKNKLEKIGFKNILVKYSYGKWGNLSWKLMIKLPVLLLGKSFAFAILLPIYYLIVLVPGIFMMWLDTKVENKNGTGLIVTAWK